MIAGGHVSKTNGRYIISSKNCPIMRFDSRFLALEDDWELISILHLVWDVSCPVPTSLLICPGTWF